MKEKMQNLITVKSIVTILLAVTFVILALTNRITGQEFLTIFTVIISFYFGTQHEKKVREREAATPPSASQTPPLAGEASGCGIAGTVCPYVGNEADTSSTASGPPSPQGEGFGGAEMEGEVVEV